MSITPLPAPPQPSDSTAEFNSKAFSWVNALDTFTTEANDLQTAVNAKEASASTSATTATTKASEASSSATSASASASTATTKASEALSSANSAAASYDSFDDRYLGAKSSDPALDNDGNALLTGSLYWNTTDSQMRVYSGSAWVISFIGGSINSTPVGSITPSTGAFTTLSSNSTTTLNGTTVPASSTLVTTTATQTLTNKTLTSPAINSPTGITKTDVGLGNVDNTSDATKNSATTTLTNKTLTSPVINAPVLTGGTINNTPIGATTPSTGAFTTLTVNGDAISSPFGLFRKANPDAVAFTKTGNGTATTASVIYVEVNGSILTIASNTSITMPTLVAGTDYAIWAKPDGSLEATSNHTSPPVANARKVGGFHYAPGGHSGSPGGGNTTPGIWAGSFWDLKFRPACPDPRGMEYFAGSWMDMYFTGVDAITNGSSKYNTTIADGSSPPKVPSMFGGNGSTTYGSYTWFEAMELATAFGKRCPTQQEFMAHAYGTTEASSIGTDQGSTVLNAAYTSVAGLFQATGVMWIWGRDRGGPFAGASWNANSEGRGSEYNAPNAALFGGGCFNVSLSGSRCSYWGSAASVSADATVGSRFVCDHLQLD